MIQTKIIKEEVPSGELVQLKNINGSSIYMTDPEGNKIEIKTTMDGSNIVFTKDESGRSIAIEERVNGTKLYHISSDNTGLPSSHEIREDNTEIVYFYNMSGSLKHFVELKPNGDRISTILADNGKIFTLEQRQIGGIVFQSWHRTESVTKEGMIWLHTDGEISTHGDTELVSELSEKFSRFLDGFRM